MWVALVSVRFLDEVIAEAPNGVLDPLPGEWDVPRAGVAGGVPPRVLRLLSASI